MTVLPDTPEVSDQCMNLLPLIIFIEGPMHEVTSENCSSIVTEIENSVIITDVEGASVTFENTGVGDTNGVEQCNTDREILDESRHQCCKHSQNT